MCWHPPQLPPHPPPTPRPGGMAAAALVKARTQFAIDLHPSKLGAVEEGVREQLNSLLQR